jgi:hypothetical protein
VENAKPGDLITVRVPPPGERLVINSTSACIPDPDGLRVLDDPDSLLAGLAPETMLNALQRSNYIEAVYASARADLDPTLRASLSRSVAHSLNDQNAWDDLLNNNYLSRKTGMDDPKKLTATVAKIKSEAKQLVAQLVDMSDTRQSSPALLVSFKETAAELKPTEKRHGGHPQDRNKWNGRYEKSPKMMAMNSTATAAFVVEGAEIRLNGTQCHQCEAYNEVHVHGSAHSGMGLWHVHRLLDLDGAENARIAVVALRESRNDAFPSTGGVSADGAAVDNYLQIASVSETTEAGGVVVSRPGWVLPFVQLKPDRKTSIRIGKEELQAVTRQYGPRDALAKKPSWEGALMSPDSRSIPLRLHLSGPITDALKERGIRKIGLDVHALVPSRRDLDPRTNGKPPTEVFGFVPYACLHIEPDPSGWTPTVWALVRVNFDSEGKLGTIYVTVLTPAVLPRPLDADPTLIIVANAFWHRHRAVSEQHLASTSGSAAWACEYIPLVSGGNHHPDEPNPTAARIGKLRIGRDSSAKKDPAAKATEGEEHHLEDVKAAVATLRKIASKIDNELADIVEKVWAEPATQQPPAMEILQISREASPPEKVAVQSVAYKPVGSLKAKFKSRNIATKDVLGNLSRISETEAQSDLRILELRNLPKENLVELTSNNHHGFQVELTFKADDPNARSVALVPRTIRLDGPEKDLRVVFSSKYLAAVIDHHPAPPFVVVVGQDMDKSPGDLKHLDKSASMVNMWIVYSGTT